MYLKPQPKIDFFLSGQGDSGFFSVFPSGDKVAVWGTYEEDVEELKTDPKALERIRQNAESFFKGKT